MQLSIGSPPHQLASFSTASLCAAIAKGRAEIFGAELAPGRAYTFPPGKAEAVFTFHGCALEIVGRMSHAYVASDTPMPSYLQLHARLDEMEKLDSFAEASAGDQSPMWPFADALHCFLEGSEPAWNRDDPFSALLHLMDKDMKHYERHRRHDDVTAVDG